MCVEEAYVKTRGECQVSSYFVPHILETASLTEVHHFLVRPVIFKTPEIHLSPILSTEHTVTSGHTLFPTWV